jgi:methylated-DNA-[protein]-cysteine S-methyltransferase
MLSPFAKQVYKLLRTVPKGRVTTYKELANAMDTKAFRAIGQVMRSNPNAPNTPCHRVVSANGTLGGFMGEKSGPKVLKKIRLLKKEGVIVHGNRVVDFHRKLYRFQNPNR